MQVLQNSQKFREQVQIMLHPYPGYCGTGVQNSQKFRAGVKMLYPYPGKLWHGRTELTQVLGTDMNVVNNLQKLRIRIRV